MALLDPCVSLPFDGVRGGSKLQGVGVADERETDNEDQPLTPTTPTTPTSALNSPSSAASIPSSSPSHMAAVGSAGASSASSAASTSAPSLSPSSPPHHSGALPTVLQSVFSYIFTDHSSHPASSPPGHSAPSTPPRTPLHSALSPVSASSPPFTPSAPHTPHSTPHTPLFSSFAFTAPSSLASSAAVSPSLPSTPVLSSTAGHLSSFPITPLSPRSASSPALASSQVPLLRSPRHCAILDLDETLLHSFFPDKVTPYQYQYMAMKCRGQEQEEKEGKLAAHQRTLYQVDVGDGTLVVLMLRPHLRPFLAQLFAAYDVGVWSAGGKLYVDAICRVLFPSDSPYRPLFQLCWDDVQVETNGLSSYTKPLTTLISRFAQLSLPTLFLVDNRKENGLHFPSQLVIAPDYLPRPWEWNGEKDRDGYLMEDCMAQIVDCVEAMKGNASSRRLSEGVEAMEEEDEESELGDGLEEDEEDEEEAEDMAEDEEEEDADDVAVEEVSDFDEAEAVASPYEESDLARARRRRQQLRDVHRDMGPEAAAELRALNALDDAMEAADNRPANGRRLSQKAAA